MCRCPVQENGSKTGPNMDSDSYKIAIDSCCSYSIAKAGSTSQDLWCHATSKYRAWPEKLKGTWKFEIEYDNGITRTIKIPNTLYCKEAPYCLLSPQHWSQQSDWSFDLTDWMSINPSSMCSIKCQYLMFICLVLGLNLGTVAIVFAPMLSLNTLHLTLLTSSDSTIFSSLSSLIRLITSC